MNSTNGPLAKSPVDLLVTEKTLNKITDEIELIEGLTDTKRLSFLLASKAGRDVLLTLLLPVVPP